MLFWIAAAALLALVVGHLLAAVYLADVFTRSKRRRVEGSPGDLGLRYEDVQFSTPDGMRLRGWYLDSPGARASVVLLHDGDGMRSSHGLLELQRDYVRRGFNVLAFDLRGRGESSGTRDQLGAAERRDLDTALAYARGRAPRLPVLLHGFGMGGALAIAAAAHGAPVQGVIADSPFISMRQWLRVRWHRVPGYLFGFACRVARRLFGADPDALVPLRDIRRVFETPILLIHGHGNRRVPVTATLNVAAASLNPRTEVWTVPNADHCGVYEEMPQAYLQHCIEFIDRAVPIRIAVPTAV